MFSGRIEVEHRLKMGYISQYLEHTKQNIKYNLAKRIIIFVSDEANMNERLSELNTWLLSCSYPVAIIEKAFFKTKLQGPAPKKEEIDIPFVSLRYSNFLFEKYFHYS